MAILKRGTGYRIDYRDQRGRRLRRTYRTKKAAETALRTIRDAIEEKSYVAPRDMPTFGTIAEEWFARKRDHRPASRAAWRVHLDRHLLPTFGATKLDAIDVKTIERFLAARRTAGLAPQTVNKILTTAGAVFRLATRHGYVRTNPARDAERLPLLGQELAADGTGERRQARPVRPEDVLEPAQVSRLLAAADPGYYRTLFLTAALTGARHSELLALQWGDCDLEAATITIRRSLSWARVASDGAPARPRFYPPKTAAGYRTLRAPVELITALRSWKLRCPPSAEDLLFPTPEGKPAHRSNVLRYGLAPALRRAGLPRVDMHSLRHGFASALINAGAPVTEVQYLLGHSKPTTTLQIYSHWFKRTETNAVAALAQTVCGTGHFLDTPTRIVGGPGV